MFSSFLFEYSLSCSAEILDSGKQNIKIINPLLFVQEIISAINSSKAVLMHEVSWLSRECLLKRAQKYLSKNPKHQDKLSNIISALRSIKKFPVHPDEEMTLHIDSVGVRQLTYVDKMKPVNNRFEYSSVEIAKNARNHNIDFQDEGEIRMHINTGDFLGNYNANSLMHLVQCLKLFCPGVRKYCFPI